MRRLSAACSGGADQVEVAAAGKEEQRGGRERADGVNTVGLCLFDARLDLFRLFAIAEQSALACVRVMAHTAIRGFSMPEASSSSCPRLVVR
ncbi:hypothetical protein QFZ79_000068 [Arthrobacter sp. V4I6]|nr:hypothetical protein [Arthrobacter sp. V1I7]MDQ0851957.1 hypothetical protein [Arthrobacter sp. V4I6]